MASAGLKQTPDASKDFEAHGIKKDNEDIHKIMHGIITTMDPFKLPANDNLYCPNTGMILVWRLGMTWLTVSL